MTDVSMDVSTDKEQINHSLEKQYGCVSKGTGEDNS